MAGLDGCLLGPSGCLAGFSCQRLREMFRLCSSDYAVRGSALSKWVLGPRVPSLFPASSSRKCLDFCSSFGYTFPLEG